MTTFVRPFWSFHIPKTCARLLIVACTAFAAANAVAQTDADFLAAKAAFERGDWRALDSVAPATAGHPLERYVRYWQIKSRLDDTPNAVVEAFLARYPDGPLADRLRIDWLKSLGKRADFATFAANYPPASAPDTELSCYAIQARMQRDGEGALVDAKPLWFTGASTPDACASLFAALLARGNLTLADRKARLRLAIANGNVRLASAIARDLPPNDRIGDKEFAAVDRDPLRALRQGRFDWKSWSGRELALYAVERAARKDASDAHDAWVKWRTRLPEADRDYGNLRIAWHASRQLDPHANQWFAEIGHATLTPEQQAWRVRAALRAHAWRDVQAAIEALPEADRQQAAWRYWHARALAAQDRRDDAKSAYEALAAHLDFYGLLAADALGRSAALTSVEPPRTPLDDVALAKFGARPDVKRVLMLARFDLRLDALREWAYAVKDLDDDGLLLAAEYARSAGLYDRAIFTAERTSSRVDLGLRYLAPYRNEFASAAKEQGIDVELLYGIARQESRFVSDIVSSAGAVGLMQLMPATARWVAKKLSVADYTSTRIADVNLNTQFGAFYFRHWLDRLGLPALAAAAYNAGPSRAKAWQPAATPLEGAIWVETIPFNETRDYVKRVLTNATLYAPMLDRPYVSLTQRLGTVMPRGIDAAAAGEP